MPSLPITSWTLSCLSDPVGTAVLRVGESITHVAVPGTVLTALRGRLPDPFLGTANLDSVFRDLEACTWRYSAAVPSLPGPGPQRCHLVFGGVHGVAVTVRVGGEVQCVEDEGASFREIVVGVDVCGGEAIEVDIGAVGEVVRRRREAGWGYKEWNDPVGGVSALRIPQYMAGWDWGPRLLTVGICGRVDLQICGIARVDGLRVRQRHGTGVVGVGLSVDVECGESVRGVPLPVGEALPMGEGVEVSYEMAGRGQVWWRGWCFGQGEWVRRGRLRYGRRFEVEFEVEGVDLWWPSGVGPGTQTLYDVQVEVCVAGTAVDCWTEKVGLRTVELLRHGEVGRRRMMTYEGVTSGHDGGGGGSGKGDEDGEQEVVESFTFVVNGRAIFAKGANFIPVHAVHT